MKYCIQFDLYPATSDFKDSCNNCVVIVKQVEVVIMRISPYQCYTLVILIAHPSSIVFTSSKCPAKQHWTTECPPQKNASEIPDLHEKLTKHVKIWKNWENVLSYVVFGGKYQNLCLGQFSSLFKWLFITTTFENSNRKISFQ